MPDDIAVILASIKNLTRQPDALPDEAGGSTTTASLAIDLGGEVVRGVVGVGGDVDVYRLAYVRGQLQVRLDLAPYWNSISNGTYGQPSLKAAVTLYNSTGVVKVWSGQFGVLEGDLEPFDLLQPVRSPLRVCSLFRVTPSHRTA